jgi:hypothetical protein
VDEAPEQIEDRFGFARLAQVGHAAKTFGLLTAAGIVERCDDDDGKSRPFVLQPASAGRSMPASLFRLKGGSHGGPFFGDYFHSLKVPHTWGDGDSWDINYIGHPMHGAASGFIWLDHERGTHDPKVGFSRAYWSKPHDVEYDRGAGTLVPFRSSL